MREDPQTNTGTSTLDDLIADVERWPIASALIASDQVPAERLADIAARHAGFWHWHAHRGAAP